MKTERALEQLAEAGERINAILIGGGVSANSRLRREITELGQRRGIAVRLPAMQYCLDNAAMIAGLAHARLITGDTDDLTLRAIPTTGA
jgi:N6-L-threonylcarbamoyladenine synthase